MRSFIRRIINYKIVKRNRLILNKLGSTSINYVDIGSVDPIFNRIRGLENIINYVGFDVNKNDKKFKGFNTFLLIDKLLYSNEVEVDFYHTNFSHCSSIYKPSQSFINRYEKLRDSFDVNQTKRYKTTTLDNLKLDGVSYIKIDTQGSELDILKGAQKTLENAIALEIEIEFDKFYEDQPLFDEIFKFMHNKGFELIDFTHFSRIRADSDSLNRGKLVSADAVFFKKPEFLIGENMTNAYILLSFIYDKYDLAISLLEKLKINVDLLKYVKRIDNKERRTNKFSSNILKIVNLVTLKNNKFYKMTNY